MISLAKNCALKTHFPARLNWAPLAAALLALFAILALATPAFASSIEVNPVLVKLDPDKATAAMTIVNSGDEPVSIRIRALSWRQDGGTDLHEATSDVVISPPIATIPAKGKQIIRFGVRNRDKGVERAYRAIVEEVPSETRGTGVRMVLRLNIPMYALAAKPAEGKLEWSLSRDQDGQLVAEAFNRGGSAVDLLELGWAAAAHERKMLTGRIGVVLANSSKRWILGKQTRLDSGDPITLIVRKTNEAKPSDLALRLR